MRGVRVAARLLLAVVVLTLAGGVAVAALAYHHGYRAYAVRTASMTPGLPPGDLLIDAPPTGPFVRGDIITFKVRAAPGMEPVVTHRVYGVKGDKIKTKGDANITPDPGTRTDADVVGEVVRQVPHAGYLVVFLRQPGGLLGVLTALVALMLSWSLFFGAPSPVRGAPPRPTGSGTPPDPSDLSTGRALQLG
jgi:signal peptidase